MLNTVINQYVYLFTKLNHFILLHQSDDNVDIHADMQQVENYQELAREILTTVKGWCANIHLLKS